jgi:hypothetical protein
LMACVSSHQPMLRPDGTEWLKPLYKKIQFVKGVLTVTHEDNDLFVFLMRSKKNESNVWRPKKGAKVVFRLRDAKRKAKDDLQETEMQWLAEKMVREAEWSDRFAIAAKLKKSPDSRLHVTADEKDHDGTLLQLIRLAKAYPKFVLNASNDKLARIRVQMQDAQEYGIIIYNPENRDWMASVKRGQQVINMTTVPADQSKFDALLDHFKTEPGRVNYNLISQELKEILKATA